MSGKVRSNLFVKFNTYLSPSGYCINANRRENFLLGRSEYWINLRAPWVSSAHSFIGRVHIGARALHVLIWYGLVVWFVSLPYSSGEEGIISSFIWFLPAFPHVERGGGSAPCAQSPPVMLFKEILQPEQGHPERRRVIVFLFFYIIYSWYFFMMTVINERS